MTTIKHQTELSANIVLFGRYLRNREYSIAASEEADALEALTFTSLNNRILFRQVLKAVFVKNKFQLDKFDDYYIEFWDQLSKATDSKLKDKPKPHLDKNDSKTHEALFNSLKEWLNLKPSTDVKSISSYSTIEVLTKTDFSDLSEDEVNLIMNLLKRMAKNANHQKSRLRKISKMNTSLDLKQTIRRNMRNGGEIAKLIYSLPKQKKLKLVLLCDVSRSMELYSRFFTHLIYAFQNSYDKIETFVFSTALHRVTELLNNLEFNKAFNSISDRVPHWSGGTTIGSCLNSFNDDYGHRMLNKKTVVLILSDGWDTGDPETIESSMKSIYKKSKKIIWLNPLAGNPNFSPKAIGMKSALPYIDVLCSAHNLESLKPALKEITSRRNIKSNNFTNSLV